MRIVITGGAGFVGSNLVSLWQHQRPRDELLVIDDMRSGSFANLTREPMGSAPGFSYRGELIARPLGTVDLTELFDTFEPDIFFHLASITDTTVSDQAKMIQDNVEPFHRLLEQCVSRQVKLIWASSAATYGQNANGATRSRRPFKLDDAGAPANVYGFSKWLMENLARKAQAAYPQAHLVGLRYFNVFGPHEGHKAHMASMVYQLAQQMLAGKRPRLFAPGDQARDQVFVTDVVEATLAAARDDVASGIYNIGSGVATSFNQIVAALNDALGTRLEPDYFDNPYRFYQDYTCADLTMTRVGLHWEPRFEPGKAITDYARWLQAKG